MTGTTLANLFSGVVAAIGSKAVFRMLEFEYRLLSDPFRISKFAVSIGVFLALFLATHAIVGKIALLREKTTQ